MEVPNNFEFKSEVIKPKRFEVILSHWEDLLEQLGVETTTDDVSDLNIEAIKELSEAELASNLESLYQQVNHLDSDEAKKEFIISHQFLRQTIAILRDIEQKWPV